MQRAVPAAIALLVPASVLITRQSGQPATQLRCRPAAEIWIIRHGEKAANASRTLDLDLSPAGVDRAKNLERLVTSGSGHVSERSTRRRRARRRSCGGSTRPWRRWPRRSAYR